LSETFYPAFPLFEWLERGGSYGSILALWFATKAGGSTKARVKIADNIRYG